MLLHVMLSIQLTINFLYSTFYYERHHNSDRRYSHKSKNLRTLHIDYEECNKIHTSVLLKNK